MRIRAPRPLGAAALSLVLVAACGGGAAGTSSPSPEPSPSASLLLRVTNEGGFINPVATLAALPTVVVYTDGRIFTPAPIPEIFPGPLVSGYEVRDVGPEGAAVIADALRTAFEQSAGGDGGNTDGGGIAADLGTTVVTAVIDGQTRTASITGGDPATDPTLSVVNELMNRLYDSVDPFGPTSAPPTHYTPEAYRVFVAPGAPAGDPSLPQQAAAWPLATPLAEFGTPMSEPVFDGLRSGTVTGADAETLTGFVAQLNSLTPVVSDGEPFTLYVLPLLPDEIPA
jgi:hypothetical protein